MMTTPMPVNHDSDTDTDPNADTDAETDTVDYSGRFETATDESPPLEIPDAIADATPSTKLIWLHLVAQRLTEGRDALSYSEIADWTGVAKQTVYPCTSTLVETGCASRHMGADDLRMRYYRAEWPESDEPDGTEDTEGDE